MLSKPFLVPSVCGDEERAGPTGASKDGVESIGTAMLELEKQGYLTRRQLRDSKGNPDTADPYSLASAATPQTTPTAASAMPRRGAKRPTLRLDGILQTRGLCFRGMTIRS